MLEIVLAAMVWVSCVAFHDRCLATAVYVSMSSSAESLTVILSMSESTEMFPQGHSSYLLPLKTKYPHCGHFRYSPSQPRSVGPLLIRSSVNWSSNRAWSVICGMEGFYIFGRGCMPPGRSIADTSGPVEVVTAKGDCGGATSFVAPSWRRDMRRAGT